MEMYVSLFLEKMHAEAHHRKLYSVINELREGADNFGDACYIMASLTDRDLFRNSFDSGSPTQRCFREKLIRCGV